MKSSVSTFLICTFLAAAGIVRAAPPSVNALLAQAESQIENAEFLAQPAPLEKARLAIDKVRVLEPNNPWAWYYTGLIDYVDSMQQAMKNNAAGREKALNDADEALQKSIGLQRSGEALALRASVLGALIQVRGPESGMTLGPQAGQLISEARSVAPQSPQVLLHAGLSAFFTPPEFGGDVHEAVSLLEQSVAAYEQPRPDPLPKWGQADAHAWLGVAAQKLGDAARAKAEFDKALALAPNYGWVKYVLVPSLKSPAKN